VSGGDLRCRRSHFDVIESSGKWWKCGAEKQREERKN
jgi:hypothetical protein